MTLGIRAKLFILSLSLIGCTLIAADICFSTALESHLTNRIRDDLVVRLDIVEHDASHLDASLDDISEWDAFAERMGRLARTRVTVVRKDGVVLGDSDVAFDGRSTIGTRSARRNTQGYARRDPFTRPRRTVDPD